MTQTFAKQLPKNDKHMSNQIWNEHNMTKKQASKASDQTITKKMTWLNNVFRVSPSQAPHKSHKLRF